MTDGFRIGRISVEGFKGFTRAQEMDLGYRHVFLIGPNGKGKSSIVEAIRWGLFGSTRRPNDIVQNDGYIGGCRVTIDLARGGGKWRLRRTLMLDGSGSRPELFDESGREWSMRDVLPQIESLGAGEGAHIIFSSQSAPLRRQPEDLTPFEKTVFSHLGLTHARAILSHLDEFMKDQADEEATWGDEVGETKKRIQGEITDLERRRGQILTSWGSDGPPSSIDTENKMKKFAVGIGVPDSDEEMGKFSPETLMDRLENALKEKVDSGRAPLDKEFKSTDSELTRLTTMRDAWNVRRLKQEKLREILDGVPVNELRDQVSRRRQDAETRDLRCNLANIMELLNRMGGGETIVCPVCETERSLAEIHDAIHAIVSTEGGKDLEELRAMENRLEKAEEIEKSIQAQTQKIVNCRNEVESMVSEQENFESIESIDERGIANRIESAAKRKESIESRISNFKGWLDDAQKNLRKFREEIDYHDLQRKLVRVRDIETDMQRVQEAFDDLVRFGESVKDVRDSVKMALAEELREKTPSVAAKLTCEFRALTGHPYFDKLVIAEEKLPRLELGVASSSDSVAPRPPSVLNGQAHSALKLVPYFAFSQEGETPTEIHLVLLDDPTQAFDRERIKKLIGRLADLGKRVQLVVATHEKEAFNDLLPSMFKRESYVVIEAINWSPTDGPELLQDCYDN